MKNVEEPVGNCSMESVHLENKSTVFDKIYVWYLIVELPQIITADFVQ